MQTVPTKRLKVLIIRFSSIGDIVLTTPVVRCLKQQLDADIHYLTKKSFQSILHSNPHIDKVFAIQKKISEVLPALKAERYDYVIDLHGNIRSAQVKFALSKKSYTFDKLNWQKWLLVNFKINRLPDIHIVERYLATVKSLNVRYDGKGLDYFIPPEDEVNMAELLPNFDRTPYYIAFVIGAAHATKRLPQEQIIAICKKIQLPIVLLGGPEEAEEGRAIAEASGAHVLNTCGQLKLNQSASVVRQAWKVITHDTGLMHIAAAFQKDIISIWGNTVPEFGMYPFYAGAEQRNSTVEVHGLPCRPCSKIGYKKCPKGHFNCMRRISTDAVVALCEAESGDGRSMKF